MFTVHAIINEIDDTFGWNMLHVRNAKRKLQKRKINILIENANKIYKSQEERQITIVKI